MATNEEAIIRHRQFLEERMDPDFGLLNTLLANRTLSWKETSEVKDKSPFYKRNSKLLDYILEKKQYSDLIWALGGNEQTHIVNYLNANGGKYISLREQEYFLLIFKVIPPLVPSI